MIALRTDVQLTHLALDNPAATRRVGYVQQWSGRIWVSAVSRADLSAFERVGFQVEGKLRDEFWLRNRRI